MGFLLSPEPPGDFSGCEVTWWQGRTLSLVSLTSWHLIPSLLLVVNLSCHLCWEQGRPGAPPRATCHIRVADGIARLWGRG